MAIEHAKDSPRVPNAHTALLLLTDGEPTGSLSPPRGISGTLQRTLLEMPLGMFTIHCFGYGYGRTLDTPLLRDIATQGKGTFSYVPDGSMVGTVFIHFFCNLITVALAHVAVELRTSNPSIQLEQNLVDVGFMRPGQTRDLYIPYAGPSTQTTTPIEIKGVINSVPFAVKAVYGPPIEETHFQMLRHKFVVALEAALELAQKGDLDAAQKQIIHLDEELRPFSKDTNIKRLREDLISDKAEKGQIMKALQHWDKWGQHYLPSVWFAHTRQEKSNFKDASMEMYSTLELDGLIDAAERTFTSLPAPTPSIKARNPDYQFRPVDMSRMIDRSGGCFVGSAVARLADGTYIRMDKLKKGMVLFGGAKVRCLICFKVPTRFTVIYRQKSVGTLGITGWHPVQGALHDEWVFPCQSPLFVPRLEFCDAVYNLVCEEVASVIEVDGFLCSTLGHGIKGPIIEHPFFGSSLVVKCLMQHQGFIDGLVTFEQPCFLRDKRSGLVCDIVDKQPSLQMPKRVESWSNSFGQRSVVQHSPVLV